MKNLLNRYNKQNTLIVISSYPKKKEVYSQGVCAVASFTKNTISSLKKTPYFKKIIVITMVIDKEEIYEENGVLVIRCFRRNKPLSYINIIRQLKNFNLPKKLLLEFEFASFGDTKSTLAILPLLWKLRMDGKEITLVIHQVVTDLEMLSGHIGIKSKKLISLIFNPSLQLFYRLLSTPVKNIIVLEENLKKNLSRFVDSDKITVIPHGVPKIKKSLLSKKTARQKLAINDEIVILYFGYLTWYKGADFLIRAFIKKRRLNGKKVRLIIAGGPSFTQEKKSHYQKFLTKIHNLMDVAPKHITVTGFVDEKDIANYYAASDLVVFPYRAFISSSGPLSFALSFRKPFLLSDNLGKLLDSKDVISSMGKAGISRDDLLFEYTNKGLMKKISFALKFSQQNKLTKFSSHLAKERSFQKLSTDYSGVLTCPPKRKVRFSFLPRFNYKFQV